MSTNVWPLDREPYHGDLVQGRLGNCFLISSLQALACCQPRLLKSLISFSPLSCSFYRQGERVEIPIVMEAIPEEYPYCRSTVSGIQWPYIIEQAYAKFYGGRFENLNSGNTSEALYNLLGKPVEEFEPTDKDLWQKIEQGLNEKTAIITCGMVVTNGTGPTRTANGLLVNHAYAILATFFHQPTREKYVVVHNPQGTNHLIKENSRVRDAFFNSICKIHPLWSNTSGTQLLPWPELQKTCNRIQICYLNVESRQILTGNWSEMISGGCSNFSTFYRNPFLLFPSSSQKNLVFTLGHTNDQRQERTTTDTKFDYAQLGITIIQLKSHSIPTHDNYEIVCQSKFWNKREVSLAVDIEPKQGQQYAIVLSTYYPNIHTSFWLQLFSKQTLPILELRTWTNIYHQPVQTINGEWRQENAGGRRTKPITTRFYQNPAYLLTISKPSSVRLILHQSFSTDVPLTQYHPIGIYVLSTTANEEITFVRARSVSRLVHLNAGEEYHLVPACFDTNTFGHFELHVLSDVTFTLDSTESKLPPPPPPETETSTPVKAKTKEIPKKGNLSVAKTRLSTFANNYSDLN